MSSASESAAHDEAAGAENHTLQNDAAAPSGLAEDHFEGETFTITSKLFDGLLAMGFSENAIKKSVASGCINEDTCTQWITMHAGHPELDTPLAPNVRVLVKEIRVLTEEEKLAKAAELKEKIRRKKEEDAAAEIAKNIENEKKRVEMGKLMLEAKELREAQQRANAYEERRKEKEADLKAKEKVQLDLAIDRLIRQGKTPEEAGRLAKEDMEEKKKRQREEAAERLRQLQEEEERSKQQRAAAQSSSWDLSAVLQQPPSSGSSQSSNNNLTSVFSDEAILRASTSAFDDLVVALRTEAGQSSSSTLATLRTIVQNIIESPLDNKKRTLKASSTVFASKIAPFRSAVRILRLCGFDLTCDESGQAFVTLHTVVLRHLHMALAALASDP